jgi:hypothetical protein
MLDEPTIELDDDIDIDPDDLDADDGGGDE